MKRPLAIAGAVLFIALYFLWRFPILAPACCAVGTAASLGAVLLYRKVRLKRVALIGVVFLMACLLFSGARYVFYRPAALLAGQTVQLTAHIRAEPDRTYGRYQYIFETDTVNGEPLHVRVRANSYEELALEPYDEVKLQAELMLSESRANGGLQLDTDRVFLYADSFTLLSVTQREGRRPLAYYISAFRAKLSAQVRSNLSSETGGLLNGLLLGDKSGVTADATHDFRQIGISHLLAVSGLHMSVWAMAVFNILRRSRLGRRIAAALTVGFVLFFMALTSFTPSVVRSGIMMLLYLGAFLFKRTPDSLNSLGGAVLVFLIVNPFAAMDIGLILSALATFGIVILNPVVTRLLGRLDLIDFIPARRVLRWGAETIAISLTASVFTIPVVLVTFGMITILAPLSNLFIAGLAAPAMVTGGIAALFGMLGVPFLSQPLFACSGFLVRLMLRLSNAFADIPYVSYYIDVGELVSLLLAAIISAVVLWVVLGDRKDLPAGVLAVATACVVAVSAFCQMIADWGQTVVYVTQGSNPCVLVQNGEQTILLGSGSEGSGLDLLERQNIYHPDFVFLWADDPDTEKSSVLDRCRGSVPVIQGQSFRVEFDKLTLESDGDTLLLHTMGRTVRIAENLEEDPADILIAGGLSKQIDYGSRPAVETNTRYAKGKNALTVPYNSDIIIKIGQDAQIRLNGGSHGAD